ncbi:PsiF family protein [Noviherbaspirillum sp.]|uniref:PsiF family protein n=1 Tax=Noviherbaspirillum sp. TaxID=1926288 RepID=UPI002FE1267D
MKKLFAIIAALAFTGSAFAAAHTEKEKAAASDGPKTEQQSKMASCNKDAAGMKGDERKAFMKDCLSAKPKASTAQKAQQDKMKSCNADAKGMKGDERKKFMSDCLKG